MRLLAFGEKHLMQGFALLGFETYPDADLSVLEQSACHLLSSKEKALILIEQSLICYPHCKCLTQLRNESAHVVIIEIPPLNAPSAYRPRVEELVNKILGPQALNTLDTETEQVIDK